VLSAFAVRAATDDDAPDTSPCPLLNPTPDDELRSFNTNRHTQAAKKFHRTPGAVAQKAMTLGIRFRSITRKRRNAA
jgi:hypothetical protein